MTPEDFRNSYKGKFRERLNKALRAEIPAGGLVLDNLEKWYKIRNRKQRDRNASEEEVELAAMAEEDLQAIRDQMVMEIRLRYNMPEKS